MFAVVEFTEENGKTFEAVPEIWLDKQENKCFWPPTTENFGLKAFKKVEPSENWSLHKVKVIKDSLSKVFAIFNLIYIDLLSFLKKLIQKLWRNVRKKPRKNITRAMLRNTVHKWLLRKSTLAW